MHKQIGGNYKMRPTTIKGQLVEQIENYEIMIDENLDKAIQLQEQIAHLHEINKQYREKMKDLTAKLRKIKE